MGCLAQCGLVCDASSDEAGFTQSMSTKRADSLSCFKDSLEIAEENAERRGGRKKKAEQEEEEDNEKNKKKNNKRKKKKRKRKTEEEDGRGNGNGEIIVLKKGKALLVFLY